VSGIGFYTNRHIVNEVNSMLQKLGALAKQDTVTSLITDEVIAELLIEIVNNNIELVRTN